MPEGLTKEAAFKKRFTAVLADLHQNGWQDGEAMALIGSLAGELAAKAGQPDWTGVKAVMTAEAYRSLLATFEKQGNQMVREGRTKHAYAIQALVVSLIAATQRADTDLAAGEKLLDSAINRAVAVYFSTRSDIAH